MVYPCESGFIYHSGRCHKKLEGLENFQDAVQACEDIAASLICFQSQDHRDVLLDQYG